MKKSSNSIRIGIAVAIILGTIAWLAFTGYGSSKSYYVTVAELGNMGDKAYKSNGCPGAAPTVKQHLAAITFFIQGSFDAINLPSDAADSG